MVLFNSTALDGSARYPHQCALTKNAALQNGSVYMTCDFTIKKVVVSKSIKYNDKIGQHNLKSIKMKRQ